MLTFTFLRQLICIRGQNLPKNQLSLSLSYMSVDIFHSGKAFVLETPQTQSCSVLWANATLVSTITQIEALLKKSV